MISKKELEARSDRAKRLARLWKGAIARLGRCGINIEYIYNAFLESYTLIGTFVGREGDDAVVYNFIQEQDHENFEDVDKIEYLYHLLDAARKLNLQLPRVDSEVREA